MDPGELQAPGLEIGKIIVLVEGGKGDPVVFVGPDSLMEKMVQRTWQPSSVRFDSVF